MGLGVPARRKQPRGRANRSTLAPKAEHSLIISMPPKRLIEKTIALPPGLLKPTAPAAGALPGGISYTFGYERQFLRLNFIVDGEPIEDDVELAETDCFYGGSRKWFVCYFCQRRRRALYLPAGFTIFGCRQCRSLTYTTQKIQPIARRVRRYEQAKLCCPSVRPRYMHQQTFFKRTLKVLRAEQALWLGLAKRTNRRD